MLNMDGVGMARTRVWASRADRSLLRTLKKVAEERAIPVVESNLDGAGTMDSFAFDAAGIATISLHGLAPGNYDIPHSVRDRPGVVKEEWLYETYRLVLDFLRELDGS